MTLNAEVSHVYLEDHGDLVSKVVSTSINGGLQVQVLLRRVPLLVTLATKSHAPFILEPEAINRNGSAL